MMLPVLVAAIIAFAPTALAAQKLVVANMGASTAQLIDAGTGRVLATVPTTSVPHEVAVSDDGKWAVVTDYGGQQAGSSLTIIDVANNRMAKTISVLPHLRPHSAVFLRDNKTMVVTSERDSLLLLVDMESGVIGKTLPTGQRIGHMVAIPDDEQIAFVANIISGTLSIVDLVGETKPVVVPVGTQTEGIGVSHSGRWVWMGSNNTGKVYVVEVATRHVVDSIQTAGLPYRIAFSPDDRTALVSNPEQDQLHIYDVESRTLLHTVELKAGDGSAGGPQGIVIAPDGSRAWITLGTANRVVELALPDALVVNSWSTAAGPDGIGVAATVGSE